MNGTQIYEDMAQRTGGDIYIGIVGPVRTGKSTFIKRFMESLVIPNIDNKYVKERAKDELPQSGSGKTIMTAEPKFVPEDAVEITLDNTATFSVRLIDCVGYMIPGASGLLEGEHERMVTTPWFDHEISITEAAETGTKKVITDHSTIGIVITTDGTTTEFPREAYIEAEARVIRELQDIGKPFLIILNTSDPSSASSLTEQISEKYGVICLAKNCLTLNNDDINEIIGTILSEFPINDFRIKLPTWLAAMPDDYNVKAELFEAMLNAGDSLYRVKDIQRFLEKLGGCQNIRGAEIEALDMGTGNCTAIVSIPDELFYSTISNSSGFDISDDRQLISVLTELAGIKQKYDRIAPALENAEKTGYGIIMPSQDEMKLEEPEIVRKNGRYGVKLRASAPSIHLIKTDIETEVSPAVGGAGASEEVMGLLLQDFEGNTSRIWESNLFGKSLYDIAGEDLTGKISKMPADTQQKMRNTLQRIINEGSGGVICIIL